MTTYQILCLVGVPSLISTISSMLISRFSKQRKDNAKRIEAVEKGLQALLRDRLLHSYFTHLEKGYVTVHEKENFRNMYEQYHALGANGVIDDVVKDFDNIPLKK